MKNHRAVTGEMAMAMIITGGAGGLGIATARQVAARGIDIGLVDIDVARSKKAASDLAAEFGISAAGAGADLAQPSQLVTAWQEIEDTLGPVDTLVNAAGTFRPNTALTISPDDWEFALRTNLTGPFYACQHALRLWVERNTSGSIVNVASTAAFNSGFMEATDYGAAKAGLIGLSTHLAVKFGTYGIRVNSIVPHSFRSPMNAERLKEAGEIAKTVDRTPLNRVAEVEEMANAIVYLAYDASYVSGVALRVDGALLSTM